MKDVLDGMEPSSVAEILVEGTRAEEEVAIGVRQARLELQNGGIPSDQTIQRLERVRDRLQDVNSALPETRAFLRERGLTNVRELNALGKAELAEHLRLVALSVQARNEPA